MNRLLALAAVVFLVRWIQFDSVPHYEQIDISKGMRLNEASCRFERMPQEIRIGNVRVVEALWNSLTPEDRKALNLTITRIEETTTLRATNFIPRGAK